jgi:hypothetical protein
MPRIPAIQEVEIGGLITAQKYKTLFEKLKCRRTEGMVQVVEHLSSNPEALRSIPSTAKKKKKRGRGATEGGQEV